MDRDPRILQFLSRFDDFGSLPVGAELGDDGPVVFAIALPGPM